MNFLRRYSEEILAAGVLVMLGGLAFVLWAQPRMVSWPNYQRLAALLPLCTGGMLISLNGIANWDDSSTQAKGKTVGLAVAFGIVVAGTVGWWLGDPGARA